MNQSQGNAMSQRYVTLRYVASTHWPVQMAQRLLWCNVAITVSETRSLILRAFIALSKANVAIAKENFLGLVGSAFQFTQNAQHGTAQHGTARHSTPTFRAVASVVASGG
mmetsp:Transcript_9340/g.22676  ORF Transcript_9340/g.22676 Transcript_9340/m.22676 type:complete len:110 (-) Transcript_9340:648-977(-)